MLMFILLVLTYNAAFRNYMLRISTDCFIVFLNDCHFLSFKTPTSSQCASHRLIWSNRFRN